MTIFARTTFHTWLTTLECLLALTLLPLKFTEAITIPISNGVFEQHISWNQVNVFVETLVATPSVSMTLYVYTDNKDGVLRDSSSIVRCQVSHSSK